MECLSCKKEFLKGTHFTCPHCSKNRISRCNKCKKLSVKYYCKCGFIGP